MIEIDGNHLSLDAVNAVARKKEKVIISQGGLASTKEVYQKVLDIAHKQKPVYGINTGFGTFSDETISATENRRLNRNLILSHAVGTGDPLPEEIVRAAMLIRANALVKGYSGINPLIIRTLIAMINKAVTPLVYSKGSLGSSGDLCMLAQMALVISRDPEKEQNRDSGYAYFQNHLMDGADAMQKAGIAPIVLENKDGLALINGATFSAGVMALDCYDAQLICDLADIAVSLSLEGLMGKSDAFHPLLHESRGMDGQIVSAKNIRRMIAKSNLVDRNHHIQDAYSLRCAPQVHGAVRDAINHTRRIITREINAATDNPLIFKDGTAVSGGNFHGEPIGLVADYFKNAIAELGAISERRIFRMLDKNLNYGLPPMLVGYGASPGLNSGVMMLQYTAAALVLENQSLCSPDSVRSLPTSANQEDHNANAYIASFHARAVLQNTIKILAIEIYVACRAIELRLQKNPDQSISDKSKIVYSKIRDVVPFQANDSYWGQQLEPLYDLLLADSDFRSELLTVLR